MPPASPWVWCIALLLLAGASTDVRAKTDSDEQGLLEACINDNQPTFGCGASNTSWHCAMTLGRLKLRVEGLWWSPHEGGDTEDQITLLTHLTLEKRWQLKSLCRSWNGPISAVVHLPMIKDWTAQASPSNGTIGPRDTSSPTSKTQSDPDSEDQEEEEPETTNPNPPPVSLLRRLMGGPLVADGDSVAAGSRELAANTETPAEANRRRRSEAKALIKKAMDDVHSLFTSLRKLGTCRADIMLVQEYYDTVRTMVLSPDAMLVNYARLQARTPLVAYVDVDMVVSQSLWVQQRTNGGSWLKEKREAKVWQPSDVVGKQTAWVIPAFKLSHCSLEQRQEEADLLARGSKSDIIAGAARREQELLKEQLLTRQGHPMERFYKTPLLERLDKARAAHLPTNYDRWLEVNTPYRATYEEWYEPFVIVDRLAAPWHDVRFRGAGRGRAANAAAMQQLGYRFMVHPSAYLVYRPHSTDTFMDVLIEHEEQNEELRMLRTLEGPTQHKTLQTPADHEMKGTWMRTQTESSLNKHLLNLVSTLAEQGIYRPVVDKALLSCIDSLPWWGVDAAAKAKHGTLLIGKQFQVTDWSTSGDSEGECGGSACEDSENDFELVGVSSSRGGESDFSEAESADSEDDDVEFV